MMMHGQTQIKFCSFFNLSARRGGLSTPLSGRFTPGKETRFPHTEDWVDLRPD